MTAVPEPPAREPGASRTPAPLPTDASWQRRTRDHEAIASAAQAHADAEAGGDLDATMATMDGDPFYELLPIGIGFRGRDAVRRYYEHFFANCLPRFVEYSVRSEWVTDEGLGQEYQVLVDGPAGRKHYDIVSILKVGDDGLLTGERLYASDELVRFMFEPLLVEAFPL